MDNKKEILELKSLIKTYQFKINSKVINLNFIENFNQKFIDYFKDLIMKNVKLDNHTLYENTNLLQKNLDNNILKIENKLSKLRIFDYEGYKIYKLYIELYIQKNNLCTQLYKYNNIKKFNTLVLPNYQFLENINIIDNKFQIKFLINKIKKDILQLEKEIYAITSHITFLNIQNDKNLDEYFVDLERKLNNSKFDKQDFLLMNICEKIENIIKTNMFWDNEISLSGAAGTGKTYLTTKLVKRLKSKYKIIITAPTHKALEVLRKNLLDDGIEDIETKTIHSFLNIKLVTDYDKGIQKFEPIKAENKDISFTDLLIVDESSMVSQDLYQYIIESIESQRVKAVLFVGDSYQLLPVDDSNSKIFDIRNKYKLEEIVRQVKDSYIIKIATKARNIIKSQQFISIKEFLNDNIFKENIKFFTSENEFYDDFCSPNDWDTKDKVIASFTNNSVNKHNDIIRKRFWNKQNIFDIPTFLKGEKLILQKANVIQEMVIHQNSEIIELSECSKQYLKIFDIYFWDCKDLNNKPLKIVDIDSQKKFEITLNQLASDAKFEKNYQTRLTKWKNFYSLKDLFVNVKYVFASTIHKLQGSTYETVYIDLREIEKMNDKDMMYRLLYVAITRASKDIKILLPSNDNISLVEYQDIILSSLNQEFKNFK